MTVKLKELYERESNHKGLFARAKSGYGKLYNWVDKNLPHNHLSQPKMPNLGQIDAKEPNFSVGKAAMGAIVGGAVTGPWAAAGLAYSWGKKKKK